MDSLKIQNKVTGSGLKTKKRRVSLIWLSRIEKQMMEASNLVHKNAVSFQTNHRQKLSI